MKNRNLILLVIGLFILIAGCLQSCVTVEKAKQVAYKNPKEFADVCATLYPIKEKIVTETKYVPANNKDYTEQIKDLSKTKDSITRELDALKKIAADDKTENCIDYKKQIPKLEQTINYLSSTIKRLQSEYEKCKSDTVNVMTTAIQESSAKLEVLSQEKAKVDAELAITKKELSEVKKSRNAWRWFGWIVIVAIGAGILFKLYRIVRP